MGFALNKLATGVLGKLPYAFRKSQFATRIYNVVSVGGAVNSIQFCNGQTNTTGFLTSHACIDAEGSFTQVALVFINSDTTQSYAISGASVAPGATLNDPQNSTDAARAAFAQVTFSGAGTATVPASTGGVPAFLVSDFTSITSTARQAGDATTWSVAGAKLADSFTRPLLHIRVAQPITAANSKVLGAGFNAGCTDAPYSPRQPTKTGRYISVQHASAAAAQLSVGAQSGVLTGTTYGPFSGIVNLPCAGIIFKYANNAMTFMALGDSITYGASIALTGASDSASPASIGRQWANVAPQLVSTPTQPIEFCNLGISGSTTTQFVARLQAVIAAGITPTHLTYASFSPNDGAGGPSSTQLTNLSTVMGICTTNNIYPLLWTHMPVGLTAAQALSSAGETNRLNWNANIRAKTLGAATGTDYFEVDQAGDGTGQIFSNNVTPVASITATPVQWSPTNAANNLHPNYNGDLTHRMLYAAKISSITASYYGP